MWAMNEIMRSMKQILKFRNLSSVTNIIDLQICHLEINISYLYVFIEQPLLQCILIEKLITI